MNNPATKKVCQQVMNAENHLEPSVHRKCNLNLSEPLAAGERQTELFSDPADCREERSKQSCVRRHRLSFVFSLCFSFRLLACRLDSIPMTGPLQESLLGERHGIRTSM